MRKEYNKAVGPRYDGEVDLIYKDCTKEVEDERRIIDPEVKSYFDDRTVDIKSFKADVESLDMGRLLRATDPRRADPKSSDRYMLIPDVKCPWGCGEFAFKCAECIPAQFIQEQLRRVVLNFPSTKYYEDMCLTETARIDYIRKDGEDKDFVLGNKDWPVQSSVKLSEENGLMILTCRHHCSRRERKRLYPHPARKPNGMNLCGIKGDDLSHCVVRPRHLSTVRARKHNTTATLSA